MLHHSSGSSTLACWPGASTRCSKGRCKSPALSRILIRRKFPFHLQQSVSCLILYFLTLTGISSKCPWKSSSLLPVLDLTNTWHDISQGLVWMQSLETYSKTVISIYLMFQYSFTRGKGSRGSGTTLFALHAGAVSCSRRTPAQISSKSTCPYVRR